MTLTTAVITAADTSVRAHPDKFKICKGWQCWRLEACEFKDVVSQWQFNTMNMQLLKLRWTGATIQAEQARACWLGIEQIRHGRLSRWWSINTSTWRMSSPSLLFANERCRSVLEEPEIIQHCGVQQQKNKQINCARFPDLVPLLLQLGDIPLDLQNSRWDHLGPFSCSPTTLAHHTRQLYTYRSKAPNSF